VADEGVPHLGVCRKRRTVQTAAGAEPLLRGDDSDVSTMTGLGRASTAAHTSVACSAVLMDSPMLQVHRIAGEGAVVLPFEARHPPGHQAREPAAGPKGGHALVCRATYQSAPWHVAVRSIAV
jgi:hypothetical protein